MNKIVYDLLLKLEQCDDRHNRCDYLMEHDEITYLLEHIEEKDKEIDRLNNIIDQLEKDILNELEISKKCQVASKLSNSVIEPYNAEQMAYKWILSRIKELKGDNN